MIGEMTLRRKQANEARRNIDAPGSWPTRDDLKKVRKGWPKHLRRRVVLVRMPDYYEGGWGRSGRWSHRYAAVRTGKGMAFCDVDYVDTGRNDIMERLDSGAWALVAFIDCQGNPDSDLASKAYREWERAETKRKRAMQGRKLAKVSARRLARLAAMTTIAATVKPGVGGLVAALFLSEWSGATEEERKAHSDYLACKRERVEALAEWAKKERSRIRTRIPRSLWLRLAEQAPSTIVVRAVVKGRDGTLRSRHGDGEWFIGKPRVAWDWKVEASCCHGLHGSARDQSMHQLNFGDHFLVCEARGTVADHGKVRAPWMLPIRGFNNVDQAETFAKRIEGDAAWVQASDLPQGAMVPDGPEADAGWRPRIYAGRHTPWRSVRFPDGRMCDWPTFLDGWRSANRTYADVAIPLWRENGRIMLDGVGEFRAVAPKRLDLDQDDADTLRDDIRRTLECAHKRNPERASLALRAMMRTGFVKRIGVKPTKA